jgi:hypothetical protein
MNLTSFMRIIVVIAALGCGAATAGPDQTGALAVPANRIVGLWSTQAMVGPCNGAPSNPIRNTLLFQAGGTLVENPRFPPEGAPNVAGIPGIYQRGQALGTWTYDSANRRYWIHLQFDNFVDNAYHGYSTVDRRITLSADGMIASGPVWSARYLADGSLLAEVCGEALSTRL